MIDMERLRAEQKARKRQSMLQLADEIEGRMIAQWRFIHKLEAGRRRALRAARRADTDYDRKRFERAAIRLLALIDQADCLKLEMLQLWNAQMENYKRAAE